MRVPIHSLLTKELARITTSSQKQTKFGCDFRSSWDRPRALTWRKTATSGWPTWATTTTAYVSLARRSARQHGVKDVKIVADPHGRKVLLYIKTNLNHVLVQFAQYRPVQWFLKPLFFQVPQREPNSLFIGRRWLYSEIADHLLSETSDNRGVIITGTPGSGKTAIMLQLVDHSCFGRGQSGLRGKEYNLMRYMYNLSFYHFRSNS